MQMNLSTLSLPGKGFFSNGAEATEQEPVKVSEVLLMYFVLMISGNPFCVQNYDNLVIISAVIPLYYIFKSSGKKITFQTVFIFTFLLGYEIMHSFVYDLDYSKTIFKLFLVLLLAFSMVQLLGNKFIRVLMTTMIIISLVSFVFTFLCYIPGIKWKLWDLAMKLFPMKAGFKAFVTPTLLVYTFHPQYYAGEFSYVRNAGIFWESGAFAVFLNVTLYLHYISKKIVRVRDLFDWKAVILIIALLSTTSTMAFLSLMAILTFFTMKLKSVAKYVFILLVAAGAYFSFVSVEFLGNKIATQLEESDERNNRFGSALMDWQDIKKRPIIGSSRRIAVLFGTQQASAATRRPNGLTNFLRDYGLIYFSAYFMMVYASYRKVFYYYHGYTKFSMIFFGIVLLWLLSFSEIIFDLPFFKALIFLGMVYVPQHYWGDEEEVLQQELETA